MINSFISLFANHRVAPNLLMLLMFLSGFYGLSKLNTQFFPDFAIEVVSVQVVWPGASAEEVQTSITVPLEQQLKSIANVSKVNSNTRRGGVSMFLESEFLVATMTLRSSTWCNDCRFDNVEGRNEGDTQP